MENKLTKITSNNIRNTLLFLELFKYRNLVLIIFKRELISTYKQTILGPLWIALNPIITSFVFTIIFSKVAKIPTDQIPPFLFYFSGLAVWNYFQNNLIQISSFYITSAGYFRKLYFPRLVVPFAYILNNSIKLLIHFFILVLFCYLIYDGKLIISFQNIVIIIFVYFLYNSNIIFILYFLLL
jgi:lipopolysaccharide transport system permease protein